MERRKLDDCNSEQDRDNCDNPSLSVTTPAEEKHIPEWHQSQGLLSLISPSHSTLLAIYSLILPIVKAQDLTPANCSFSQGDAKPGNPFNFATWMDRGLCVRGNLDYAQCRVNLISILSSLDPIHSMEYSASASVLALLPTIGALFGTPTSEIWTLLTVLPFGGSLAMLLSFGSTIMPNRIMDYENSLVKHSILIGNVNKNATEDDIFLNGDVEGGRDEVNERMQRARLASMSQRILARISQRKSLRLPRKALLLGLVSMILLFCGVQVAMGIVENGAVYSDGCTYNWWFHVWYAAGK